MSTKLEKSVIREYIFPDVGKVKVGIDPDRGFFIKRGQRELIIPFKVAIAMGIVSS